MRRLSGDELFERTSSGMATTPLAERLAEPFGLCWVRHPARLPQIASNLFWHARYRQHSANAWLRALLVRIYAG